MSAYQTPRLSVVEAFSGAQETEILVATTGLLTAKVVESLPSYFRNINSISDARDWFKSMTLKSRLFMVMHTKTNAIIGFVFVSVENDVDAHIGYLLGDSYWGKGYATELLKGVISFLKHENKVKQLIAGVAINNIASCKLLDKIGFVKGVNENIETVFYEYQL